MLALPYLSRLNSFWLADCIGPTRVRGTGLEPVAIRLKAECSTIELATLLLSSETSHQRDSCECAACTGPLRLRNPSVIQKGIEPLTSRL